MLSTADMLQLSLPDGDGSTVVVIASKVELPQLGGRGSIWHGSINGKSFSSVTFSVVRGAVVGIIAFDGRMFRLRTADGVHVVEWLDTGSLPQGAPPDDPPPQPTEVPMPECEPGGSQQCPTPADLCETDARTALTCSSCIRRPQETRQGERTL